MKISPVQNSYSPSFGMISTSAIDAIRNKVEGLYYTQDGKEAYKNDKTRYKMLNKEQLESINALVQRAAVLKKTLITTENDRGDTYLSVFANSTCNSSGRYIENEGKEETFDKIYDKFEKVVQKAETIEQDETVRAIKKYTKDSNWTYGLCGGDYRFNEYTSKPRQNDPNRNEEENAVLNKMYATAQNIKPYTPRISEGFDFCAPHNEFD